MKKQMIAALLILITTAAFAGNEGPQAEPEAPKVLIAQLQMNSGFVPDWMPHQWTIDIEANGTVTTTKTFRGGEKQVQKIAKLASEVLKSLKLKTESTQMGELIELDPEAPECMDAPSTTYYAFHADGQKVPVSAVRQCKQFSKENATSSDYEVQSVLDGLKALAALI